MGGNVVGTQGLRKGGRGVQQDHQKLQKVNAHLDVWARDVEPVGFDKLVHDPDHPSFSQGGGVGSREHWPIEV